MGLAEMIKAWKNDGRSTILCGCGRMSWKRIDVPFIRHFVLKMRRKIEVVVWDGILMLCGWLSEAKRVRESRRRA